MKVTDKITITNEDNMLLMARYPDKYFDLAIVDIPYGLGDKLTQGGTWANKYKKSDADWDVLPTKDYFNELFRISKNQIIWGGNYTELPATRCFLIWDKIAQMETMADCEFAWTSFDKNAKIFRHVRNTSEKRIHITQKPISLYKWILDKYAKEGDKILDTHLGSGSIAIACHDYGFELTACELDKEYYDKSIQRIKNHTNQTKLF
jgi:site-specific DNA-methyltransferase (adenine-specific)